jgi:hypothetical protein
MVARGGEGLKSRTSLAALRQWVTAIAVYAIGLHALAMAAMPATGFALQPAATAQHAGIHESGPDGAGSHSDGNHLQCCVLCGVAGCGGPSGKAPAFVLRARRRCRVRPLRLATPAYRVRGIRSHPPRGPPSHS